MTENKDQQISRYKARENALAVIYNYLFREESIDTILMDNAFVSEVNEFMPPYTLNDEMREVVYRIEKRREIYEKALEHYLKGWSFNRLGYIEQAALLIACSELELGYQEKNIIINEAIRLTKKFGDPDSYKMINGVLDAI